MFDAIDKYTLLPGYIFFSEKPHLISTVLGSCISICIWDSIKRYGGMNHYIFARANASKGSARYGDISTPYLVRLMTDAGSSKGNLKAHIIGGGKNQNLSPVVGDENIRIAEEVLENYRIEVLTRDTGGETGRKLIFNSESGEILVYKGISIRKDDWYR